MSFQVTADAYSRFMGRYSEPLATEFVALLNLQDGQRALDVGCGPGVLTRELVQRLGPAAVTAVDPSEPFVTAARAGIPGIDVQQASAEKLPFADNSFDVTAAQLVVHFMRDPVAGLTEMGRVTRVGGLVAANVWDHAGGTSPLTVFWQAVQDLDPEAPGEATLAGTRDGHLVELFELAGLRDARQSVLTVRSHFATFADWWEPFTLGVGPAGSYVAHLEPPRRAELAGHCATLLPPAPFEITASAWTVLGRV